MARLQDYSMKHDFLDLQSRLEHLITYSSQLVFVSGEGMGKQLSFAQQFLSNQNELANIGYVDASANVDVISYRKKFIQQLVGPLQIDYSKPLTFLLPRVIKEPSQFILIAVTHADLLPDEFLQELWDLVLQNRFAKNRHHLNILVFGEKAWASRAKGWLPANSNNKPVLLANELIDRDQAKANIPSELDQLISSKRQQFNERLAARESHSIAMPNVLGNWWMKVALAAIFFVTFIGILFSQYVTLDEAKAFYNGIFDGQQVQVVEGESAPIEAEQSAASIESTPEQAEDKAVDDTPSFLKLADDQRRVVDWENAVKSLPKEPVDVVVDDAEISSADQDTANIVDVQSDAQDSSLISTLVDDQTVNTVDEALEEAAPSEVAERDFDYQVEDIVSIEQLDALNNNQDQATELEADLSEAPDDTSNGVLSNSSPTTQSAPLLYDADLILGLNSAEFVLQLSAMSTEQALTFYLQTNQLTENTWVYKTQRFGGDWFVVLLSQTFDSLQSANAQSADLNLNTQPFAKSVAAVQQELTNSSSN